MASVEKTYADALFSLLEEENAEKSVFDSVVSQLTAVKEVVRTLPDFVKLMNTPTISDGEKLVLVENTFKDKTSDYVCNFLRLLVLKKRVAYFPQICNAFRILYNERFKIAEITVTSSMPLNDGLREKITQRMSQITGKAVSLTEKVDKSVIGGIVVDYGNTRLDGSIKTRLAELKKDIGDIIA